MEAGQPPKPLFGEAMVRTPRGDSVRVPLFKTSSLGDTVWVVPLVVFWQVVIQDPIMSKGVWKVEAEQHSTREASTEELAILHKQMYLSCATNTELMVPLDGLVSCLDELSLRIHSIEATLKSLETIKSNSVGDVIANASVMGGFAQLTQCPLSRSQVQDFFSLEAEFQEYQEYDRGHASKGSYLVERSAEFLGPTHTKM